MHRFSRFLVGRIAGSFVAVSIGVLGFFSVAHAQTPLEVHITETPDIVYHLAAFFANQNSVDYPQRDLMTNGLGTLLIYQ